MTNRIKTGITKLDEYIGGFPEGRSILVTGNAGAGKTIIGLQFAKSSCAQGLRTVYMSTEETSEDLRNQAKTLGFDLEKYEEEGLLKFLDISSLRRQELGPLMTLKFVVNKSKGNFSNLIKDIPGDTQSLIIDSVGNYLSNKQPHEFRDDLDTLNYNLYDRGVTTLMVLDSATSKEFNDLALYCCYGAINLMKHENPYTGKRERVMDIIKMRNSKTPIQLIPYEIIAGAGIEIISTIESS